MLAAGSRRLILSNSGNQRLSVSAARSSSAEPDDSLVRLRRKSRLTELPPPLVEGRESTEAGRCAEAKRGCSKLAEAECTKERLLGECAALAEARLCAVDGRPNETPAPAVGKKTPCAGEHPAEGGRAPDCPKPVSPSAEELAKPRSPDDLLTDAFTVDGRPKLDDPASRLGLLRCASVASAPSSPSPSYSPSSSSSAAECHSSHMLGKLVHSTSLSVRCVPSPEPATPRTWRGRSSFGAKSSGGPSEISASHCSNSPSTCGRGRVCGVPRSRPSSSSSSEPQPPSPPRESASSTRASDFQRLALSLSSARYIRRRLARLLAQCERHWAASLAASRQPAGGASSRRVSVQSAWLATQRWLCSSAVMFTIAPSASGSSARRSMAAFARSCRSWAAATARTA
mmetsp:Transcript_43274/g.106838  ORF Transcript_43274/g.106838 Transcript_43274/m.106838 type:complete len:400 (+) Transcript_43274:2310-3509(+)